MKKESFDILKFIPILIIAAAIYTIGYNLVNKYQMPYKVDDVIEDYQAFDSVNSEDIVNINTADVDVLQTLLGVDKKTAEKIIELREELGKFKSPEELLFIKDITKSDLLNILNYVTY